MQGRERVTLQRTQTIPQAELAPFHHLKGTSHKEHHAYLRENPKPVVRDLVKEREWRLRNGYTSPSKSVTLVEDVTQIEHVFTERRVLVAVAGEDAPLLSPGRHEYAFEAAVPRTAPSAFYVAGGNWSQGKGYLAEIVYTASAAVVGAARAEGGGGSGEANDVGGESKSHAGAIGSGPTAPVVELSPGEHVLAAAKRHFLVTQQGPAAAGAYHHHQSGAAASAEKPTPPATAAHYLDPASFTGPSATGVRSFITGGAVRATVTLNRASYSPGADCAVVKLEANCSVGQPCHAVTLAALCSMTLTASGQKWAQGFELNTTRGAGFPPGYYGERFVPFRILPGWPSTTHGALVRCNYGVRSVLALPATLNLTLEMPVEVLPTATMYSAGRSAGALYTGPLENLPAVPELPPGRIFRPPWVDDSAYKTCRACFTAFTIINRRHHCRHCGSIFCKKCAAEKVELPRLGYSQPQRVCRGCHAEASRTGGAFVPVEEERAAAVIPVAAASTVVGAVGAQQPANVVNGAPGGGDSTPHAGAFRPTHTQVSGGWVGSATAATEPQRRAREQELQSAAPPPAYHDVAGEQELGAVEKLTDSMVPVALEPPSAD